MIIGTGGNIMRSYWEDTVKYEEKPALEGDISTDILIVGGGTAGLLCGYMLKNSGADCVIAEAGRIGFGITKGATAKITFQHGCIYDSMIKKRGKENALKYLEIQKAACMEYEKLAERIDCSYEKRDAFVYSLNDREKIEKEALAYERLHERAQFTVNTELPFPVAGAVRTEHQAQFNPLQFCRGLSKELKIYENTKVREIMPGMAKTDRGNIRFRKIIIATHFPIINKHGWYFIKMYQSRSYLTALKGAPLISGMYVDENDTGMTFRSAGEYLFVGGGGHRTGKTDDSPEKLRQFSRKYYPEAREEYFWAAQDCITLDGIPYVGAYSESTPDMLVITGFNKWGFSSAMAGAMILKDIVFERENEYADIFSPSRSMLSVKLFTNIFESAAGLLCPTVPRCPHLGCALKYNPLEHSWDCPCHGSRFEENGELIDNPAIKNAECRTESAKRFKSSR